MAKKEVRQLTLHERWQIDVDNGTQFQVIREPVNESSLVEEDKEEEKENPPPK